MKPPCIFCANLSALEVVHEDDATAVVLHEDWAVRGHAMVVWKRHVQNISELSEAELAHFASVYQRAEGALLALTGADRAVMLKPGIATPHLHLHIYPVKPSLDRAAVMDIIEGRVREERDPEFVREVRARLDISLSSE